MYRTATCFFVQNTEDVEQCACVTPTPTSPPAHLSASNTTTNTKSAFSAQVDCQGCQAHTQRQKGQRVDMLQKAVRRLHAMVRELQKVWEVHLSTEKGTTARKS